MQDMIHPYKILFVEDEKPIRDNYIEFLKIYFDEIYEAEDGEEAYKIYKQKKPHILILDINIPKLNGIDLLKKIREEDHTTKAIMLTAHENIDLLQKTIGLKLTKYLVKPVSRKIFISTLELVISELSNFTTISKNNISINENYSWSFDTNELSLNNSSVYLTNKERKVFALLVSSVNKTFSIDDIIYDVWEDYTEGNINALKTIIKNLRKKLPEDTIKNVFGVGYKIEI